MASTPLKSDDISHVEIGHIGVGDNKNSGNGLPTYSDQEVKRILRKVDIRLLPMLAVLFLISYLDRGNIGNAKVAGMNESLALTDRDYRIALSVGHIPDSPSQSLDLKG